MSGESHHHQHQPQQQQQHQQQQIAQSQLQQPQQQLTQTDYMRMLNSIFQQDLPYKDFENIFSHFEKNFSKQPTLINTLVDYYFIYGVNSLTNKDSKTGGSNFIYIMNPPVSNNKSIIDLICRIPDDLCNKLFDKIFEFMKQFPMQQPQQPQHQHQQQQQQQQLSSHPTPTPQPIQQQQQQQHSLLSSGSNNSSNLTTSNTSTNFFERSNTNMNDLIAAHTTLLFVLLINTSPSQMFNQYSESIFQIFINLFKYHNASEQKIQIDGIVTRNVKWSVRLYFYVCYGFYAFHLMQFIKKKEPQLLNKDSLTQILFYLRLHPSLFKDKSDTEKNFKQFIEDPSLEWRQYCLDTMCTNYNHVIQNMPKLGNCSTNMNLQSLLASSSSISSWSNSFNLYNTTSGNVSGSGSGSGSSANANLQHMTTPSTPNSNIQQFNTNTNNNNNSSSNINNPLSISLSSIKQTNNILNDQSFSSQPPLSPSYIFTSSNKSAATSLLEIEGAKKSQINLAQYQQQQQQSSVPSTPTPTPFNQQSVFQYPPLVTDYSNTSIIELSNYSLQQQQQQLQMSSSQQFIDSSVLTATNTNKNTIKNLTAHFMMSDGSTNNLIEPTNTKSSCLDANLTRSYFNLKKETNQSSNPSSSSSSSNNNNNKLLLFRQKSNSDSNLYCDFNIETKSSKSISVQNSKNYKSKLMPSFFLNDAKKQVKSEMRDTNIKEPQKFIYNNNPPGPYDQQNLSIISGNFESDRCLLNQTPTNLLKQNSNESNDIISAYFSNSNASTELNSYASTITKLKEDMNHLALQLIYERHLREKYEEDSNRLHFIKTERDQLCAEKAYSEKVLKQLVEQYKKEVEDSLNTQCKIELNAYKDELFEKNKLIENLQKNLEENQKEIKDWREKYDAVKVELKNSQKIYGETVQLLEKEQRNRTKQEIDYQYMNSLRYTTDILRKKLLLMSKSQHELKQQYQQKLQIAYNQELVDLTMMCNNSMIQCVSPSLNDQSQLDCMDLMYQTTKSNDLINTQQIKQFKSSILNMPLYKSQQETIDLLQQQVDNLKKSYNHLLIEHNMKAVELDTYKQKLLLKETKLEELNQSIQTDVIEVNAEIMKSQHRVYSSLLNINKRLEEEILKLKAKLSEQTLKNDKLEKKQEEQAKQIQQLMENLKKQSLISSSNDEINNRNNFFESC